MQDLSAPAAQDQAELDPGALPEGMMACPACSGKGQIPVGASGINSLSPRRPSGPAAESGADRTRRAMTRLTPGRLS